VSSITNLISIMVSFILLPEHIHTESSNFKYPKLSLSECKN